MNFERLLPSFIRRRFVLKLAIAFVLIVIVVGTASAYMITQTTAVVSDDVEQQQQTNARTQAATVSEWLTSLSNTGTLVGYSEAIQSQSPAAVSRYLSEELDEGQFPQTVVSIHYVNTTTRTVTASSDNSLRQQSFTESSAPWTDTVQSLSKSDSHQYRISRPYRSSVTDTPVLAVTVPVPDQPAQAVVMVASLRDASASLPQRTTNSFLKVVNEDGTVVLSQRQNQILSQNMGPQDARAVESMAVKKGLSGKAGYMSMEMDGTQMTMGFAPVAEANWTVMYHQPRQSAFAVQQTVFQNLLVLLAVGMGAVVVAGVFVGRSVVPPLNTLTTKANAIESGNLDVTIITTRGDEFGQLFRSFATMRDSLQERITETEQERERAKEAQKQAEQAQEQAQQAQQEAEAFADHIQEKAASFGTVMATAADGDLTRRMTADSESEAMQEIATSFNEMMDDLLKMMDSVSDFAQTVNTSTDEISASAEEVGNASQEVSQKMQVMVESATRQHENIQQASDEMTNLSATIEEVASSTDEVADKAAQAADLGDESTETARTTRTQMETINTIVTEIVADIEALNEEMDQIGEIVNVINGIAEQTNMLALNANIEAARTGETGGGGDGFAVVADEIKQLAAETEAQTTEIEALIEQVRSSTKAAVSEMREMSEEVDKGQAAVEETVEMLEAIVAAVEDANQGVQTINEATNEQATSVEETVSMIEEVGTSSDEMATDAEDVAAAAQQQTASLSEVSENIATLSEQATELDDLMNEFTLQDTSESEESSS